METYIEILHSADGERASRIFEILSEMGLKPSFGQHDFVYCWKKDVTLSEVLKFLDQVLSKLKGTGAVIKFSTIS
ncbi:MAG: hypothetical protein JSW60_02325 [Thermoplasmatales archaeon]|nr:MAG: hypothetical protein JSW60_02325 [Thermoplasmatales archaeon]